MPNLKPIRDALEAVRSAGVEAPPEGARLRQFVHGMLLPLALLRVSLRDPQAKRRLVRTAAWQVLLTVAIAVPVALTSDKLKPPRTDSDELRDAAAGLHESAAGLREAAREGGGKGAKAGGGASAGELAGMLESAAADAEEAEADAREASGGEEGPDARAQAAQEAHGPAGADVGDELAAMAKEVGEEVNGAAPNAEKRRAVALKLERAAARMERRAQRLEERAGAPQQQRPRSWWRLGLLFWAALLSALYLVQKGVIALSRDHHDAISRDVSLLTALEPEDGPLPPRVRLNLKWAWTRARRYFRAYLAISTALPLFWLVSRPFPHAQQITAGLSSAWFGYWWVVFSASKTARAWSEAPRDPWFMRGWDFLVAKVPLFRWGLPRAYGRLLRRFTNELYPPATCAELQPYAMAGLGVARLAGSAPLVKLVMRPFFSVAAAHLIEQRRARSKVAEVSPSGAAAAAAQRSSA